MILHDAWLVVGDGVIFGEPWGCFIELCGKPPKGFRLFVIFFQRL